MRMSPLEEAKTLDYDIPQEFLQGQCFLFSTLHNTQKMLPW